MKLELKHLAAYLPYKLVGTWMLSDVLNISQYRRDEERRTTLTEDNVKFFLNTCKPILRPLSEVSDSLFEEIGFADEQDFIQTVLDGRILQINFNKLLSNHFDVFGLIPAGLAVDINTLSNG